VILPSILVPAVVGVVFFWYLFLRETVGDDVKVSSIPRRDHDIRSA
jgi:hypothetical protein